MYSWFELVFFILIDIVDLKMVHFLYGFTFGSSFVVCLFHPLLGWQAEK